MTFKVGDQVKFSTACDDHKLWGTAIGTVIEANSGVYTLEFKQGPFCGWGTHKNLWKVHERWIEHAIPPKQLSKEERLLLKCQTLWNNSKYVKSFPEKAY